jgi:hypothetical protein
MVAEMTADDAGVEVDAAASRSSDVNCNGLVNGAGGLRGGRLRRAQGGGEARQHVG